MDDDATEQGGLESAPPAVPIVVGNLGGGALVQEPMEKNTMGGHRQIIRQRSEI